MSVEKEMKSIRDGENQVDTISYFSWPFGKQRNDQVPT